MTEETKMFNDSFAERLRGLMATTRLRQTDIARALDVSSSTVSSWTYGTFTPTIPYMIQLAEMLGVSLNYLLTGKDVEAKVVYRDGTSSLRDLLTLVLSLNEEQIADVFKYALFVRGKDTK